MNTTLCQVALAAALAGTAAAQTSLFLPPQFERHWGRTSTALLAGNTTRTQMIYSQPFAAGTTILGIRLRCAASTIDRAAFTADMEIACSSTTAVPGAMSNTWTANVGSDEVIVLPQQTVNIPAMPANRGTGQMAEILFPTPFTFGLNGSPNLLIDLKVLARSAGASWSTDRVFAGTNGRATTFGIGCGTATINTTSTNGTYVAGSTVTVTLAGGPANGIAALVPTLDLKEFVPGFQLPFGLSLLGSAPGCDLLVGNDIGPLPVFTDAAGAASASLTIPATFTSAGLGFQWLTLVPPTVANPLGIETTAARAIWIGPEISLPTYQYIWNLSSASSATATSTTTDSIPVAELILQ